VWRFEDILTFTCALLLSMTCLPSLCIVRVPSPANCEDMKDCTIRDDTPSGGGDVVSDKISR
jgi:hypothetical protein